MAIRVRKRRVRVARRLKPTAHTRPAERAASRIACASSMFAARVFDNQMAAAAQGGERASRCCAGGDATSTASQATCASISVAGEIGAQARAGSAVAATVNARVRARAGDATRATPIRAQSPPIWAGHFLGAQARLEGIMTVIAGRRRSSGAFHHQHISGVEGYSVDAVSSTREAMERLAGSRYPIVVSDIYIDQRTGIDVLNAARAADPRAAVILMSARGSMETVMAAHAGRVRLPGEAVRADSLLESSGAPRTRPCLTKKTRTSIPKSRCRPK